MIKNRIPIVLQTLKRQIRKAAQSNRGKSRNKGRKASEQTKNKMSESRKGKIHWNKGVKSSVETKLKISKYWQIRREKNI